ncbi:MAG: Na/Pi symporter [Motiliproteus sp.]|nr:Na/Pi symporter [Motiliproteus sp.]MCW9054016.1 Na/Pi symporter [Motiliproteus sp.]
MDSLTMWVTSLGGLGIFLLGMIVMTDGLRALAGDQLKSQLMRYTRTPTSGAAMGATCTAILQSSSATTVAAVGFVSAELMQFHNALGIIFGANLGTTITGWLVAVVGFKLKLGLLALPLILVGAILKLFASNRIASSGLALSGFGLIFVGISMLQQGMGGLQQVFDFSQLPGDNWLGILQLVAIGAIFTIITQSSSAGVAAALTALYADLIVWQQAAALVIGMDIGTTVTAAMATIGSAANARRTGLSHVIFNLCTGVLAILLIAPYRETMEWLAPGLIDQEPELSLVGFHTFFNLLGVLIVLPLTPLFSRLMYQLVKKQSSSLTAGLDPVLLSDPIVALNAAQESAISELNTLLRHATGVLGEDSKAKNEELCDLPQLQQALNETHEYLDRITTENPSQLARLKSLFHTLDHLQRLHERFEEEEDRAITIRSTESLQQFHHYLSSELPAIFQDARNRSWMDAYIRANRGHQQLESDASRYREQVADAMARGLIEVPEGTDQLEAIRWSRRVSQHISRTCYHLQRASLATAD